MSRIAAAIAVALAAFMWIELAPAQAPDPAPCLHVPLAVVVNLDNDSTPQTIDHVFDAVKAGQPRVLHIDRRDAAVHRAVSLRPFPPRSGFDRDEYPPAMALEGGAGADVRYINPADNRRSGARMGAQLADFCNGQTFILEP